MKLSFFLLVGFLTLVTSAATYHSTFTPAEKEFDWEGFHIKIVQMTLASSICTNGPLDEWRRADQGSVFIELVLAVTNTGNRGVGFIPQNDIKLVIGSNEFDAEDIDPELEYLRNIEPTMTKKRMCFFEIPAHDPGSFILRFAALFTSSHDVTVVTVRQKP
jgi:hypothetical protein